MWGILTGRYDPTAVAYLNVARVFLFRSSQQRNGTVFGFEHHRASYPIICQYSC